MTPDQVAALNQRTLNSLDDRSLTDRVQDLRELVESFEGNPVSLPAATPVVAGYTVSDREV